jgi:hypothetical protein
MDNLQEINPLPTTNKNIPIDLLIDYSRKNLSYSQIAKLAGCSKTNVINRFKAVDYTPTYLKAFKDNRADVMAHYQRLFLNSITEDEVKRMAVRDRVVSAGILYDKERVELGLAGQIVGFEQLPDQGLDQAIAGLMAKADKIGIKITEIVGQIPATAREVLRQNLDVIGHDRPDCVEP